MPSDDLLLHFQKDLYATQHWRVSGTHYGKTAEAWLRNMDQNLGRIREIFESCYPKNEVNVWIVRWRVFFMACAELWNYKKGEEWLVSHYVFERHPESVVTAQQPQRSRSA